MDTVDRSVSCKALSCDSTELPLSAWGARRLCSWVGHTGYWQVTLWSPFARDCALVGRSVTHLTCLVLRGNHTASLSSSSRTSLLPPPKFRDAQDPTNSAWQPPPHPSGRWLRVLSGCQALVTSLLNVSTGALGAGTAGHQCARSSPPVPRGSGAGNPSQPGCPSAVAAPVSETARLVPHGDGRPAGCMLWGECFDSRGLERTPEDVASSRTMGKVVPRPWRMWCHGRGEGGTVAVEKVVSWPWRRWCHGCEEGGGVAVEKMVSWPWGRWWCGCGAVGIVAVEKVESWLRPRFT